ncbi:hypothetical protein EVAR_75523_1 [Eumeta japonica]|uniref:Uncharacterized protein n=1 Tax=Eumeta variegata TaxID=151549 RepID=A0A4C1UIT6_EUMVA|nr:hypothetical protein EVAR_75523_1 [Eumeta japonica]
MSDISTEVTTHGGRAPAHSLASSAGSHSSVCALDKISLCIQRLIYKFTDARALEHVPNLVESRARAYYFPKTIKCNEKPYCGHFCTQKVAAAASHQRAHVVWP